MNRYIMVKNTYEDCGLLRISFGMAVVEQTDESSVVLQTISGITSNKDLIRNLVNLCNKCELDPIHMEDIVEDFINEMMIF